jgi:nucleoside-diphosphate-sugar epimerase
MGMHTQQKALVTGGSGFIASHLVQQLLEAGDTVNATVRSLNNTDKLKPLHEMQKSFPGKLHLFEADLLAPDSFAKAMKGCDVVYHVASPFLMPEKIKDGYNQMLRPALEGVINVLSTVNETSTVTRVVLTSTVGAIFGDYIDVLKMENCVLSEAYFNTTSTVDHNPYHYSKVAAEQEAWEMCRAQDRWDMVAINPGLVLGPTWSATSDSGSLFLLDELMKGLFFYGVPDLSFTTVDVREVAFAHIAAAKTTTAKGRYILAEKEMTRFLDMARLIKPVHKKPYLLPRGHIPNWLLRLIGPLFGLDRNFVKEYVGIRFPTDNRRSIEELGVRYRPIQETLTDHYQSWVASRGMR